MSSEAVMAAVVALDEDDEIDTPLLLTTAAVKRENNLYTGADLGGSW